MSGNWMLLVAVVAAGSSVGLLLVALVTAFRLQAREKVLDQTHTIKERAEFLRVAGDDFIFGMGQPYLKKRWFWRKGLVKHITIVVYDKHGIHSVVFSNRRKERRSEAVEAALKGVYGELELSVVNKNSIDASPKAELALEYQLGEIKFLVFIQDRAQTKTNNKFKTLRRFRKNA